MNRRNFLLTLPALAAVPVLAKAFTPARYSEGVYDYAYHQNYYEKPKPEYTLYGDGIHDDTKAFQAWADDKEVFWSTGERVGDIIFGKSFRCSDTIYFNGTKPKNIINCHFDFRSATFPTGIRLNFPPVKYFQTF